MSIGVPSLITARFIIGFLLVVSYLHASEASDNRTDRCSFFSLRRWTQLISFIAVLSLRSVLYVWAGQDPSVPNAADFVAVVDFTEMSPTYGNILRVAPLVSNPSTGIGQANNEPHHSSVSSNRRYYITGGLLSFASKQKEIFVWRIPLSPLLGPVFVCGIDAPGSACTDEFQPFGPNYFLVSMMCDESANSPGDMVLVNPVTCTAKSHLKDRAALTNFNPHGYGRLKNGSIFTADYIVPITLTETDPSKVVFQSTARHFFPDGSLQRTFNFNYPPGHITGFGSGIGFMELKAIPNDLLGRAYACGTNTNFVYLITPGIPEPVPVLDASQVNGHRVRPSAGIISFFPSGKLALMTFQMRYILLMDTTNPESPQIIYTFDFCTDSSIANIPIRVPGTNVTTTFPKFCAENSNIVGTHVIVHPPFESRFIVMNYFLKFGLAQFPGTRSVHVFKLNRNLQEFSYDHRFNPNFSGGGSARTFSSLQAYPHHAVYLKL